MEVTEERGTVVVDSVISSSQSDLEGNFFVDPANSIRAATDEIPDFHERARLCGGDALSRQEVHHTIEDQDTQGWVPQTYSQLGKRAICPCHGAVNDVNLLLVLFKSTSKSGWFQGLEVDEKNLLTPLIP